MHQKSVQMELPLEDRGEAPNVQRSGEARRRHTETNAQETTARGVMERVVERGNLKAALKRVRQNKGSAGIDGMGVDRSALPGGELGADPDGIARRRLPADAGAAAGDPQERAGCESLGIPTVLDRFIQQTILQVLQPMFDPHVLSTQLRVNALESLGECAA